MAIEGLLAQLFYCQFHDFRKVELGPKKSVLFWEDTKPQFIANIDVIWSIMVIVLSEPIKLLCNTIETISTFKFVLRTGKKGLDSRTDQLVAFDKENNEVQP